MPMFPFWWSELSARDATDMGVFVGKLAEQLRHAVALREHSGRKNEQDEDAHQMSPGRNPVLSPNVLASTPMSRSRVR